MNKKLKFTVMKANQKSQFIGINLFLMILFFLGTGFKIGDQSTQNPEALSPDPKAKSIKIGLLLDTSNSMDGLIDQAKSQLWNIVNELSAAKCDGETPELEIALYEYGNDGLTAKEGYIRLVTPLTSDLDQLSKDLFSLRTNGGSEFCGYAIKTALNQLDWETSDEDLKLIFIAGNEPFTQGPVNYRETCLKAYRQGITINTIFCGNYNEGIRTSWKDGADLTDGHYMSIDQNCKTVYVSTPYDDQIDQLNSSLNDTYIYYGKKGASKKANQLVQDENAKSISYENKVSRTISKSSNMYKNTSWDLVDASEEEDFDISEIESEYLPNEIQSLDNREKLVYIETQKQKRIEIQKKVAELNVKRTEYIQEQNTASTNNNNMLDNAMMTAIKSQAKAKSFQLD